jgi:PST family polysaccharide transporter
MENFLRKIREKLDEVIAASERKRLSVNFANFGLFQIINYIIPLVTIPFIVRIIGPEKFGVISIAYALTYYLWIIVDYGYNISGVQLISQNQDNTRICSQIVKNIFIIQIVLNLFCVIVLLLVINLYEPFSWYKNVFIYYFLVIPAHILLASWFYTGLEQVKYISLLSFISRIIYVILIFSIIRSEQDFILIPIFYSGSMLIGGIISLNIIVRKFKLNFGKTVPINIFSFLKRDRQIYISNIFMNLYRNSNILILSVFVNEASVGIYSAGEKIIRAIQTTFSPITQAFYPYISRITVTSKFQSQKVIKYILITISVLAGCIAMIIFLFSDFINHLAFGKNFQATARIMQIASPVIFFGVVNYIIGIIFMTNYSLKKEFSYSVITVGLFNIVICSILSYYYHTTGAAISYSLAEILLLLIMCAFIIKNKEKWKISNGEF